MPKWLINPFEFTALNRLNISDDVEKSTNVGRLGTALKIQGLIPVVIVDDNSNTIVYGNEYAKACQELGITYLSIIAINAKKVPDNVRHKDLLYIKYNHEDKLSDKKTIGRAVDLLAFKMSVESGQLTRLLEYANISQSEFDRYIKVAKVQQTETLPDTDISLNKLYEIALIPEQLRTIPLKVKGRYKWVEEMTVRELREVKRKYK